MLPQIWGHLGDEGGGGHVEGVRGGDEVRDDDKVMGGAGEEEDSMSNVTNVEDALDGESEK